MQRGAGRPANGSGNERFSASVAAVSAAFGDPTRREIYLHVRSNPGCTVSNIAKVFSLHPNVARHHLDRLAAGGYLSTTIDRGAINGGGGGRPPKTYRLSPSPRSDHDSDHFLEALGRPDTLLASLLVEALELVNPEQAESIAEGIGRRHGLELASRMNPDDAQRSVRAAMHAMADALTANGFDARAEDRGPTTAVISENCPFGEAATRHPLLCSVDRGMVRGLIDGLCGFADDDHVPVTISSRARGDESCTTIA